MGIHVLKRIEDKVRDVIQGVNYVMYMLLNPFKFKQFPKLVRKILVVELFNIGDVIVMTPVLRALRNRYPNAQIDVLTKKGMDMVLAGNPQCNHVFSYAGFFGSLDKLKKENYDMGVVLHPGSLKISFLLLMAGVRYRVGCAKAGITYGKGFFLNKKVFPNNQWQHKVDDNLDVVQAIGVMPKGRHVELSVSKDAERKVKKLLKQRHR